MKNKKSMGLDNINASFLKLSLPHILESLTYVYNLCLNQNVFPSIWKMAKIIPLPKSKDIGDMNNFRPISLLSILSKPLEKHIFNHLIKFTENHDLFHPFQSGFRQHHSCHTALTRICDSWLSAINNTKPEITGSVFLDLKKAFDLVDHDILLMKLSMYFQNNDTIALLRSYLINRTQQVFLNGNFSNVCSVKCGVPQGSVLGPLLFGLFINDLPLHLTNPKVISDLFADDNSMHSSDSSIDIVESNLQQGLVEVSDWCKQNRMVLHPGKTKSMAIATRQKHQIQPLTLNLYSNSCMIEQVNEHKVLGITFDQTLSWKSHIDSLCKRLAQNLFLLGQLKFFLNSHALKTFFHAHIMCHINYASTIWSGASNNNLTKLNSLHRRAVKLISDTPLVSTDQKLKNLKILPLNKQFDFNTAVLMFKVKNNMAPPYLQSLLTPSTDRYGSDRYLCPKTRVDIFKSSFAFSGPFIWNTIPICIKSVNSLQTFKSSLKYHLLNS
jgi:retron-type reverse transcriptase